MRRSTATGPSCSTLLESRGAAYMLDVKLHDIPRTVHAAVRALVRPGVALLTVHALGGSDMLAAAVEAAAERAAELGIAMPKVLAITLLTSIGAGRPRRCWALPALRWRARDAARGVGARRTLRRRRLLGRQKLPKSRRSSAASSSRCVRAFARRKRARRPAARRHAARSACGRRRLHRRRPADRRGCRSGRGGARDSGGAAT